ncbi:MAG: phosphoribosylformylglycinamidine cyclo-ligase, partial [Burkholderiaceae bacterium]
AYGNLNMGAGFAIYLPAVDADRAIKVAAASGVRAWNVGRVETGPRRVVIEPLELTFEGGDLHVRA